MNYQLTWEEQNKILDEATALMEKAIEQFYSELDPPIYDISKQYYRYPKPTSLHFQFLKAVRIISGLNAYRCLLEKGYVQELGVLIRTIYDFMEEINYVQEAHESRTLTAGQKKIIDIFFRATPKTTDELLKDTIKWSRVTKKEIFAAIGRFFSQFSRPERTQKIMQILHNTYSGYVHGDYLHIMELYSGREFHLRGMLNTPREDTFKQQYAMLVHRGLNVFAMLALNFKLTTMSNDLRNKRIELENKGIYRPLQ